MVCCISGVEVTETLRTCVSAKMCSRDTVHGQLKDVSFVHAIHCTVTINYLHVLQISLEHPAVQLPQI